MNISKYVKIFNKNFQFSFFLILRFVWNAVQNVKNVHAKVFLNQNVNVQCIN